MILIPKSEKDRLFTQNYCLMSSLPAMEKMAKRIVKRRLEEDTEVLGILLDEQLMVSKKYDKKYHIRRCCPLVMVQMVN